MIDKIKIIIVLNLVYYGTWFVISEIVIMIAKIFLQFFKYGKFRWLNIELLTLQVIISLLFRISNFFHQCIQNIFILVINFNWIIFKYLICFFCLFVTIRYILYVWWSFLLFYCNFGFVEIRNLWYFSLASNCRHF